MPRDLFFKLSASYVISGRLDTRVAISNPDVRVALVTNDNSRPDPSHGPGCLLLVVPTPEHTLVANGEPKAAADIIRSTST